MRSNRFLLAAAVTVTPAWGASNQSTPAAPIHSIPGQVCLGQPTQFSGSGEPGHLYLIAISASSGPTPALPGLTLDLGPDFATNIIGFGFLDAAGQAADIPVNVSPSLPCGLSIFSQMVTLELPTLANAQASPGIETEFVNCTSFASSFGFVVDVSGLPGESLDWTLTDPQGTPIPEPCGITEFPSNPLVLDSSGAATGIWSTLPTPSVLNFMGCVSGSVTLVNNSVCGMPPE